MKNIIHHNDPRDPLFGQTTEVDTPDLPASPLVLSKTAFNKHGWSKLGMAAFQRILESVRASTSTTDAAFVARAAVGQYDSADLFEKTEVESLGALLANAGFMTPDQVAAMTGDNWPKA